MIADTSSQDQRIHFQRNRLNWRWVSAGILVAGMMTAAAPILSRWYQGIPSVERSTVQMDRVIQGDLIRDIAVSGRLVAANAPQVYSSEAGVVELLVNPGDQVDVNQVVARVNNPELMALIQQEQASVNSLVTEASRGDLVDQETQLDLQRQLDEAKVALNAAHREYDRAKKSYDKHLISQSNWAKAQDDLEGAKLRHQHSIQKVQLAEKRLVFEQKKSSKRDSTKTDCIERVVASSARIIGEIASGWISG